MKPAKPNLLTHLIYCSASWSVRLSRVPVYTDVEMSVRVYDLTLPPPLPPPPHTDTKYNIYILVASNRKKILLKMDKVLFHISDNKYILAVLVLRLENEAVVSTTENGTAQLNLKKKEHNLNSKLL